MSVRSLLSKLPVCTWCTAAAVLAMLCAAVARPAQTPEAPPKPAQTPAEPVKHLEAWPKLDAEALKTVKTDIERLRKAHTPQMATAAEDGLVAAGGGIVPHLLPTLPKESDEEAKARIRRTLERVTSAEHSRLLQTEFENKSTEIRAWTLRRCATWRDAGLKAPAEAALARAQKLADKADPEELYAAALCVTSTGSPAGLETLRQWAIDSWGKRGVEMRTALEGVRGPAGAAVCGAWIKDTDYPKANSPMLPAADRQRVVASLNMLAGCGDRPALARVKPFLDSNDNSIRIAAINAVRGIADGEPPVADLPVFDAIELAKKLKSK
jgi:hypothetical protein